MFVELWIFAAFVPFATEIASAIDISSSAMMDLVPAFLRRDLPVNNFRTRPRRDFFLLLLLDNEGISFCSWSCCFVSLPILLFVGETENKTFGISFRRSSRVLLKARLIPVVRRIRN